MEYMEKIKKKPKLRWYRREVLYTSILTCRVGTKNAIHIYKRSEGNGYHCIVSINNYWRLCFLDSEEEGMIWGLEQLNIYLNERD